MRIAKHEYPDLPIAEIIRKSIHEYWNRPHRSLGGKRPNEVVKGTTFIVDPPSEHEEDEYPSDEEDTSSDDEQPPRLVPCEGTEGWQTPRSGSTPRSGHGVLAYVPQPEKLDFEWIPAEVLEEHDGVFRVKPEGHRATVLNQRWIQPMPETNQNGQQPTTTEPPQLVEHAAGQQIPNEEAVINEEPTADSPRRSQRNRRKPLRYM
jgi:hypothetical protein